MAMCNYLICLVPGAGIEPAQPCGREILSLMRRLDLPEESVTKSGPNLDQSTPFQTNK